MKFQCLLVSLFLVATAGFAQEESALKQQLRGTIVDNILHTPISGATVTILRLDRSEISNAEGVFRFADLDLSSKQLHVSCTGYKPVVLDNIMMNAGKETVLQIALEPEIKTEKELIVRASTRRNRPINEMSTVSARAFTVEETQKYAAAVNDPLRMATAFPGVMTTDDGNNDIVIRGNSPAGLLWRMEGIDIPNPNHFANAGGSGGGISILSAQLLGNSDFITGAFSAEYGNAISGVFDLHLRKGNNEKKEYTIQAGVLGLNVAAEGPFSKNYKGSYLVNYRYSTLELLNKAGIDLNTGSTNFQDLSYHVHLPTKKMGSFSFFGFSGLSSERNKTSTDSEEWQSMGDRYDTRFSSNTMMNAVTHRIMLSSSTQLKTSLAYSINSIKTDERFREDDLSLTEQYQENYLSRKLTLTSSLSKRIGARHSFKSGVILNFIGFDFLQRSKEDPQTPISDRINTDDNTSLTQVYGNWQFRVSNRLRLFGGLHLLYLNLNQSVSVEPRLSASWSATDRHQISFGYGLHSQVQPMGVYFARPVAGSELPNKELDFTKAQHFVLSHSYRINPRMILKTELYYQDIFNVPVSRYDTSSFSMLNVESDYITDPLVNKGTGKNYGLEISLEKYLDRNYYFTLSSSLYESRYKAADGIERDTRFNGNYIFSLITGRDFLSANKKKTFGLNLRTIAAGGYRTTPIDTDLSADLGYTVFRQEAAFSEQNQAYFRADLRISLKWNKMNRTSTISLDIQNLTNRQNVYNQWYDAEKANVFTQYQNGLIPVLNYKLEF